MSQPVDGLKLDLEWPPAIEDADWRDLPDLVGDEQENDEEGPAHQWVIDSLGFDPDELDTKS